MNIVYELSFLSKGIKINKKKIQIEIYFCRDHNNNCVYYFSFSIIHNRFSIQIEINLSTWTILQFFDTGIDVYCNTNDLFTGSNSVN